MYTFGFAFLSLVSEISYYKYTINKRKKKQILSTSHHLNTYIHISARTHKHTLIYRIPFNGEFLSIGVENKIKSKSKVSFF